MLKLQIPVNTKGEVFEFKLAKEKVTIGRRHDNDIRIKETYVSAYHAELSRGKNGEIFLRDRDSSNGTFLNGKRVRERVELNKGDILRFGSLKCSVEEVIEKLNERVGSESATPIPLRSNTTSVSVNSSRQMSLVRTAQEETTPLDVTTPATTDASSSDVGMAPLNGATYTATPGKKDSNCPALTHELESLKKQLNRNQGNLKKARGELKSLTEELVKTREKAKREDLHKLEKIETLERRLESKSGNTEDLEHRLRVANSRAEQLENELEHHKSDTSVEIKAAIQRFTHTRNDNVLLQETLEALESERNKFRDEALRLGKKLAKTCEGFSFQLQNSGRKLESANQQCSDLEKENRQYQIRMKSLEADLDSLQSDFEEIEAEYLEKLDDAEALRRRSESSEATLIKDLESANEELRTQKSDIMSLESMLESTNAEKEAAEEDWKARVIELKVTNEKLTCYSQDLETLESQIRKSSSEITKLRSEKDSLEESTKKLRTKEKALVESTERMSEEKESSVKTVNQVKEEGQRASQKLDTILQNLYESEKKVNYLRSLEGELEKSVLRAQRSALSRKGIYRDDDESYTTIWPETEQLICRELIDRLELLEDLLRRYQQNWFFPKVAEQLNLLRDSFIVLLKNHSVDQFDLEPGTELSVDSRKKIQLISVDDLEDPKLKRLSTQQRNGSAKTRVLQTLRPGYIYSKGGEDVIIRKAEVIVA